MGAGNCRVPSARARPGYSLQPPGRARRAGGEGAGAARARGAGRGGGSGGQRGREGAGGGSPGSESRGPRRRRAERISSRGSRYVSSRPAAPGAFSASLPRVVSGAGVGARSGFAECVLGRTGILPLTFIPAGRESRARVRGVAQGFSSSLGGGSPSCHVLLIYFCKLPWFGSNCRCLTSHSLPPCAILHLLIKHVTWAGEWGRGALLLGKSHGSITSGRLFLVFRRGIGVEIPHPGDL